MTRINALKLYFLVLGLFTLFWWPLSHWFYPDWYHQLMGFEEYDYSLVKIIGTVGVIPVLGMFFSAANPIRNRDFALTLIVFFVLLAVTYVFLINIHGFPAQEYFNVGFLMVNTIVLGVLFPWRNTSHQLQGPARNIPKREYRSNKGQTTVFILHGMNVFRNRGMDFPQ